MEDLIMEKNLNSIKKKHVRIMIFNILSRL